MTGYRDYKEEAAVTRQAARLKLAEFRAERQKRRNRSVAKAPQRDSGDLPSSSQIAPTDFFDQASDQRADFEPRAPHTVCEDETVTGLISSDVPQIPEPSFQETPPPIAESDLFELPAIGPGMVWMLHQCGIGSLQQLSVAKSDDLAAKLGVVGQIISMEPWIAYARERQADPL